MRPSRPHQVAVVLALFLLSPPLAGQIRPQDTLLTVERYLDYETVSSPQLSPDGARIVYVRSVMNRIEDRVEPTLWIMNADGSRNRFFGRGSNPVWSPDGSRIAYLGEGDPKGTQIFVRWVEGDGIPSQVTRVTEAPADLQWSPDGRRIGFTMFVPKAPSWKIDLPSPPDGAKWAKTPRIVDRLHYRQDRRGFSEPGYVHLFLVPADGGTPRQLTTGDYNVGARFDQLVREVGWAWAPDGKTIVTEGLFEPDADRTYRDANLYALEVATGRLTRLTPDRGTWTSPVISPDGRQVAFVGYPAGSFSYRAADLYTMNLDGSGMTLRTRGLDRQPTALQWAPDGGAVYFLAEDQGVVQLFRWGADGTRALTSGAQVLSGLSLSRRGEPVAVAVRSTARTPSDLIRFLLRRPAEATQLTTVNDDLLEHTRLGDVEELWYASTGGARIQGWLVKPPGFDPGKHYPLILEIHGGPHAMYNTGFNFSFQNFAANGYVVLYTNPRGSTGYGSAFGNAIERAYPGVDYEDLMAGVDTALGRGYIDGRRMYVGGCSGGGVLSSWVIGHTDRFAAAAVRCPVIDWLSMAGQTDIPGFTYNFFARPFWEDPAPWLKQSPLMYVGNVKTPTLLMTGELDLRTPMPQTEEYFAALKQRGVPTMLLRFDGEYHGTASKPSNWMRTQLYMLSWYGRYPTDSTSGPS